MLAIEETWQPFNTSTWLQSPQTDLNCDGVVGDMTDGLVEKDGRDAVVGVVVGRAVVRQLRLPLVRRNRRRQPTTASVLRCRDHLMGSRRSPRALPVIILQSRLELM